MLSDGAANMIVVHQETAVKVTQTGHGRPPAGRAASPRPPWSSNPIATEAKKCSG